MRAIHYLLNNITINTWKTTKTRKKFITDNYWIFPYKSGTRLGGNL